MSGIKDLSEVDAVPFAKGNSCEVFHGSNGRVLKLFLPTIGEPHIRHEILMVNEAFAAGLTSLVVQEKVEVGSRTGLIYNRIEGRCLKKAILAEPWRLRQYAKILALHHVKLHQKAVPENFPPLYEYIEDVIKRRDFLGGEGKIKAQKCLEELHSHTGICHGNITLLNAVIKDHTVTFIDWVGARKGNTDIDVALCWLRLVKASQPQAGRNILQRYLLRYFANAYFHYYCSHSPSTKFAMQNALPLAALMLDDVSQSHGFSAFDQLGNDVITSDYFNLKGAFI